MRVSYEGIGQWAATFTCAQAAEGEVVKISGSGAVSPCGDGDGFCGMVVSVGRDGGACAVALGGMVTAGYSGDSVPALGWTGLSADGSGGVKAAAGGRSYLVVDVDESGKTVTFVL
ncbi:hypothetical protein [uncultured Oscillibacter sp.]|uniref:hypothetical protein n=1 Tax=uncultured Oscillibacter sp. TaxID=876091 RepID=UPI0025FB1A46|nr:hypothetical protein [uncultured Oscillibacter sp.]